MTSTTCLNDPHMQEVFGRSNIPDAERQRQALLLDDYFANVDVRPRFIDEVSLVEFFRKPDGSSMGSDSMLLGVLRVGLIFMSTSDFKEVAYSQSAVAAFVPDDLVHGRNYGEFAIQALTSGSAPVFRIAWDWSSKGKANRQFDAAAAERDRVLKAMRRGLQLSRGGTARGDAPRAEGRKIFVGMKALDSRGEYLVEFMIDGYGSPQYVGPGRDGEHLFSTWDDPDELLKVWQERFADLDVDWAQHAIVRLCT